MQKRKEVTTDFEHKMHDLLVDVKNDRLRNKIVGLLTECKDCRTCKGTGKQCFHGHFFSYLATCNFCGGHGTREEEYKWYDRSFKERGLT